MLINDNHFLELKEEEKDGFSKLQQLITNNADISIDAIDKVYFILSIKLHLIQL